MLLKFKAPKFNNYTVIYNHSNYDIYYYYSGKTTISNDGATIMKLLDIVHPAAKTLVDISLSQDAEVRTNERVKIIHLYHYSVVT